MSDFTPLDVEAKLRLEKKAITRDAIMAGLWLAMALVTWFVEGSEFWLAVGACMSLAELQSIYKRFRLMDWMAVVQRQDAVVEYLLQASESKENE